MTDAPLAQAVAPKPDRPAGSLLRVVGYFVVFFAALTLAGILFLLGGIGLILIPGPLPLWLAVAYVAFGIIGSVAIALVAADRAFRVAPRWKRGARDATSQGGDARTPAALGWVAAFIGTVVAGVLSAVLGTVILKWLGQ
jgi:hypothetical protein